MKRTLQFLLFMMLLAQISIQSSSLTDLKRPDGLRRSTHSRLDELKRDNMFKWITKREILKCIEISEGSIQKLSQILDVAYDETEVKDVRGMIEQVVEKNASKCLAESKALGVTLLPYKEKIKNIFRIQCYMQAYRQGGDPQLIDASGFKVGILSLVQI